MFKWIFRADYFNWRELQYFKVYAMRIRSVRPIVAAGLWCTLGSNRKLSVTAE